VRRDIGVEPRSDGHIAGPVASDGQLPRKVGNRSKWPDQQIVSFAWHHRSDREKPNNGVVAAKRRRSGITTWSHNTQRISD
jgi:hypothetical protein